MKKIFALGWMLVAALALTNCSKEETVAPEVEGQAFELFASTNGTRTTMADLKTSWVEEDAMNVWTAATEGYQSHGQFTISDVENGKFTGTLDASFDNTTAHDWYAIYPYKENLMPTDNDANDIWMYVGHSSPYQNGNNSQAHLNKTAAPLYGVAKTVAGSETPVFQMHHLSTFVRVRVTNNTANPFTVASVYMTSENELNLAGSYYIDITGSEVVYTPSLPKTEVKLTVNNGEEIAVGEQAEFYLPLAPIQFGEADEMLTVDITTTEGATISVEKTIPAGTKFAAGVMNTLKVEATEDNTEYPEAIEPATWSLMTSADDIVSGGEYVILAKTSAGTWAYLPTAAITKNPAATAQNIFDGATAVYENTIVPAAMRWTVTKNTDGNFVFTTAEGNYLSCSESSAQSIAISSTVDAWSGAAHTVASNRITFKSVNSTKRYLGIYQSNSTWRGYDSDTYSNYGTDGLGAQIILYYCGTYAAKAPLAKPEELNAVIENETNVVVSWKAVENAASYTVTCGSESVNTTETTHTFTVAQGLKYEISVIAHPAEGSTLYSDSEAATTTIEIPAASNAILTETFDDITTGNSTSTGGSGTAWDGNDNWTPAGKAYKAGGAVRLGSGSATGSITSKALDLSNAFTVSIAVKGWTNVEGKLTVTVGDQEKEIAYTEVMADDFGVYTVEFDAATAASTITIATTAKRAFIDSVIVSAK